jgi:hypothetical protein
MIEDADSCLLRRNQLSSHINFARHKEPVQDEKIPG